MKYLSIIFLAVATMSLYSCSDDEVGGGNSGGGDPMEEFTIYEGAMMTFTKADEADPTAAENQDRITDKVWITRGNNGGEIYNAVSESSSSKNVSPAGTEWAQGSISNIANLQFSSFRSAVGEPKNVVGKDLVLHLIEDDIYIPVKFTAWTASKAGGFAYERATP